MKKMIQVILTVGVFLASLALTSIAATLPNIVFIFADDLGYGDVQVLNPDRGKIATPHIDELAHDGMIFTDAHTSSSVCTPSRYSLMTGRYNWRSTRQAGVTGGFSKSLIPSSRMTVASLLKSQGYNTAMMGKWHLGMEMPKGEGMNHIDWNGTIKGGPYALGFDYYFGISASLDMPPYIYIENDGFRGECTTTKAFFRKGPAEASFEAIDVLDDVQNEAVEFIHRQDASQPFFAYIALPSPHTPIVPTSDWQGKSELGPYGDFVMQTDSVVGQIVAAVEAVGLRENTIIIVSSDNGCSKAANIQGLVKKGHYPSAQYRGSKSDLWDGGHRVPFIVRWPAVIEAGTQSDQLICLTDFFATCADLIGAEVPADAGEDSVSFLPAFQGQAIESSRAGIVHHSFKGFFAYRMGKWKLLLAKGSAGWTSPTELEMPAGSPKAQLYDMEADPGETTNLYESHPEVAARLLAQLESDVARGRSTAGAPAKNDTTKINLWKSAK